MQGDVLTYDMNNLAKLRYPLKLRDAVSKAKLNIQRAQVTMRSDTPDIQKLQRSLTQAEADIMEADLILSPPRNVTHHTMSVQSQTRYVDK